jgi:hypothetical protein
MPRWNYKINIKQHLNSGETAELFERAKAGVIKEVKTLPHFTDPDELDLKFVVRELESVTDVWEFNWALGVLYDWADFRRVWLGILGEWELTCRRSLRRAIALRSP